MTQMPSTLRELLSDLDRRQVFDQRRYAAVRRYISMKAREKNQPVFGSFELTPLCNFDCKMCYVHLDKGQMGGRGLLSTAQWKEIMRQAIDGGMLYASLTGGECLTYAGFRELYLFLQSRGIEVNILSNGALLESATAEFLRQNPPAQVQISIYGASEEAYERVTGQRSFGKVMENVLRLRDMGIAVKTAVTPSAFMHDGEQIVRMLHEKGLPMVINSGLLAPRTETGRALAEMETDGYIAMMKLDMELQGHVPEPDCMPDDIKTPAAPGNGGKVARGVRCGAGRSAFAVDWKGGMRPCSNFPCDAQDTLALGFAEAWRRVNETALNFPLPVECEECGMRDVCKQCVAEHYAGASIGHASPAVCEWGRKMVVAGLLKVQQPEQ